jgi:hypothetical protein
MQEKLWLHILCSRIGLVQQEVRLDCDSQSAIFLAKNLAYHSNTNHIDVQYHFVRDRVEDEKVLLDKVDMSALRKVFYMWIFPWFEEVPHLDIGSFDLAMDHLT